MSKITESSEMTCDAQSEQHRLALIPSGQVTNTQPKRPRSPLWLPHTSEHSSIVGMPLRISLRKPEAKGRRQLFIPIFFVELFSTD